MTIRTLALGALLLATTPALAGDCPARAEAILLALDEGRYDDAREHFDARMSTALPADQLGQVWTSLPAQVGARKSRGEVIAGTQGDNPTATIPLEFERMWLSLFIACDAEGKVGGLFVRPYSPPQPAASGPWTEREVKVAAGDVELPGTLTLPEAEVRASAVLVHGSGPNDRDETIGPNKPFRDLAHGLAAAGIATLRYDKRTLAAPASLADRPFTVHEEVVADARAALGTLATQPELAEAPRFLIGHSLGAMLAHRIADGQDGLTGVVLLAAPARDLPDMILAQSRYIAALDGDTSVEETAKLAELEALVAQVRALAARDADRTDALLGAPPAYWLDLARHDPIADARRLALPTLLLQGEADYQVTMVEDYAAWFDALSGESWFELDSFEGLNHLFMPAGSPAGPNDYLKAARVEPQVIARIAEWVGKTR